MPREAQLKVLHVVVGVIADDDDRIVIQQRSDGPFAGLWEFPGGKVEPAESVSAALSRELHEELGLRVDSATPLITITHHYPDRIVTLDTHVIDAHDGRVRGVEGQPIRWVPRAQLFHEPMLPADRPLSLAINLPHVHLMMKAEPGNRAALLEPLDLALATWRRDAAVHAAPSVWPTLSLNLAPQPDVELAAAVAQRCAAHEVRLLLFGAPTLANLATEVGAAGIQCPMPTLGDITERPISEDLLFGVSAQNEKDIVAIAELSADFAVLSVEGSSRDDAPQWSEFARVVNAASLPVYASADHANVNQARMAGAQGIVRWVSLD